MAQELIFFKSEAGWWCARGERERERDRELSSGFLHVSELFTRISWTCVRRGALPLVSGRRRGVRCKKKMMSGWNEVVGTLGIVRQICLFADGHTASNAPDLF